MKNSVKLILNIYKKHGAFAYGEDCSVLSHSFQAGVLAEEQRLDDELILAAFLHDIGHLCLLESNDEIKNMDGFGLQNHDELGANFLKENGFSQRIITTVKNHVNAKRYLCCVDEKYVLQLSEASQQTMVFQGGRMSIEEARTFEQSPFFEDSILIRKLDEAAKGIDFKIIPAHWNRFTQLLRIQYNNIFTN